MLLPPVIYEDDSLIAFDKPSGLPIVLEHGGRAGGHLLEMMRARFGSRIANVHRIDAGTSGVVLCAKTKPALDILSGQFQAKKVQGVDHAIVAVLPAAARKTAAPVRHADGSLPDTFAIALALGEDRQCKGRMRVCPGRGGKECTTEVRILERFGWFAFVECRPLTGRPHQVRVHLAAVGAPVLNDPVYGEPGIKLLLSDLKRGYKGREREKPLITRLALHVSRLTLVHPVTRESLTLQAPLPREFEIALKYLRKFASGPGRLVR